MIVQIRWIILLVGLFYLHTQVVFSQSHSSKDNYTGAWETPESWDPIWTVPQTTYIEGMDIIINGYITVNGSLSFSGSPTNLIINDTLVIKGDLLLDNYNNLTVNGNGILIVRGNFNFNNHAIIITNNYIVITGDINVGGPDHGSFTGNDNPVEVFIGGTISPIGVTTNNSNYPALNCTAPITTRYPHSNCSYGDITDIINDPIYSFFQSTCITATFTSSDADNSFCAGTSVTFTAGGGANYNFRVNGTSVQNSGSMTYTTTTLSNGQIVDVIVTNAGGCTVTSAGITNTVLALPTPTLAGPTPVCVGVAGKVYTTEAGMSNYIWTVSAGGTITAGGGTGNNTVTVTWTTTGAKTVTVNYTNANGCTATSPTTYNLTVNALPVATASNNGPLCVGSALNLTGGAAGMTTYSWTGPSGFTSLLQNPSVSANATLTMAGVYTLKVTNASGCTNTATKTVVVNALPVAKASNNGPVCSGSALNLTGGPVGMTTYSWTGPSGFTSNSQSPSVSASALAAMAGVYTLTVTNASGCTNTATTTVEVNELPIPSVITPNGDGKNDYFVIGEIIGQVELIIFNRWGNEEYTNGNYLNDWDGRNNKGMELPNDTYFYVLKFENVKIKKGSVLIKR